MRISDWSSDVCSSDLPEYIIPAPFDPRLMEEIPVAVAKSAMDSGVATKTIAAMDAYRETLRGRPNPTTSVLSLASEGPGAPPKRVHFAAAGGEGVLHGESVVRVRWW